MELDAPTMDEPNQHRSSADDDPLPPRCIVDLIDAQGSLEASCIAWTAENVQRAADALGCTGEARVRVVGDDEMAHAHEQHTGVAGTTDVLTFDLRDDQTPGGSLLDVDIMVCVDEARRRAAEFGHEPKRELLLYIIHGMLHCLGHDDRDQASFERMHAAEDRVLEQIGVGATFQLAAGTSASETTP